MAWGAGSPAFNTLAICLMPDHLHCLWTLPENDHDYSLRWREIKRRFSTAYRLHHSETIAQSASRIRRGEAPIWQRRFREHTIRDEADQERHLDYIPYNPVKHRLVNAPAEWPYSSFHQLVRQGMNEASWGESVPDGLGAFDGE